MRTLFVVTSFFWLMPATVAFFTENYFWCAMALSMLLLSALYHLTEKFIFEVLDTTFAIVYIFAGPYLLYTASASVSQWMLVTLLVAIAGYAYLQARKHRLNNDVKAYMWWHGGVWHFLGPVVTTIIYLIHF